MSLRQLDALGLAAGGWDGRATLEEAMAIVDSQAFGRTEESCLRTERRRSFPGRRV